MTDTSSRQIDQVSVASSGLGRLYHGQTAIDFVGRRKIGLIISTVLIVLSIISIFGRGLNLGIDFEGGVSWDVPAAEFDVDQATAVLNDNEISTEGARIQRRSSDSGDFIKVQVGDQTDEVGDQLRTAFAEAANVPIDDVNVNLVSSSWGSDITNKAVRALIIFLAVVAIFISLRFEWRMALAAIAAMIHDVVISVGIYSIFQFVVTPATVIAFLTILGYSLYDTIVVFDRVRENEARYAAHKPPYDDIVNVSMNQVLMRSLNTSFSSIVPVVSLLLIGSGLLGATTLSEFALALLIGMATGAYSSIFVASPLLGVLKQTDANWTSRNVPRAVGEALRDLVMGGMSSSRKSREMAAGLIDDGTGDEVPAKRSRSKRPSSSDSKAEPKSTGVAPPPKPKPGAGLSHPPRPRKKKRR